MSWIHNLVKKAAKKHFPETYEKVKGIVGKVKKKAKEVGRKGELLLDSGIYSNKYMAENPARF